MSIGSFFLRMRWANEACGNDTLRELIAQKEEELDQMRETLMRHETRAVRYWTDYERAKDRT